MPASKAQQKAVNKYMKENYDRINLTVPKGKKDIIQACAEAQGQSVNAYINAAIDEKMSQWAIDCPTTHFVEGMVWGVSKLLRRPQNAQEKLSRIFRRGR